MIMKLFCDKNVTDISLFVTKDEKEYAKFSSNNDTSSAGQMLSDGQIVYFLEEKSNYQKCW